MKNQKIYTKKLLTYILIPLFLILVLNIIEPKNEFTNIEINVPSGYVLDDLTKMLREKRVIDSEYIFKNYYRIMYGGEIKAGRYSIERPMSIFRTAWTFHTGDFNQKSERVTIPEGQNAKEIAFILLKKFPLFDAPLFLSKAVKYEGYLFPDTYFIPNGASPETIVQILRDNYNKQKADILSQLTADEKADFIKNESDIIKVASILEKEAIKKSDKEMIADIIARRIKIRMPIQMDATLVYVMNKSSLEFTSADLKSKSPYNTYTNLGLPPTPISNPGEEAILAVIRPVKNDFWYYLSDASGAIHYAKTHDEHVANKVKYLSRK